MKQFSGYKAEAPVRREKLPAGGYVARIMDAREQEYSWGSVLLISFDIAEGEHKDFFANDYRGQQQEDKKWRGTYRLRVPKDDGSEQDAWSKRSFCNAMWAVEASNSGYHWDWNESGLKGKLVGVLFRNKEWEMNGNTGWTTECCSLVDVESIRENRFTMPKDKPLKQHSVSSAPVSSPSAGFEEVAIESDDDMPF